MDGSVVRCPSCGQANRVPQRAAGKRIRCGRCQGELQTGGGAPVVLTDATFETRAAGEPALVVDFWAPWCGPCRTMAPVIDALAESMPAVTFAKVNVDENPRTAARFGIQGIPTLVLLARSEEKGRVVGAVGEAQIRQAIERHLRDL